MEPTQKNRGTCEGNWNDDLDLIACVAKHQSIN